MRGSCRKSFWFGFDRGFGRFFCFVRVVWEIAVFESNGGHQRVRLMRFIAWKFNRRTAAAYVVKFEPLECRFGAFVKNI